MDKPYSITCKQCNGTAKVTIKDDQFIDYIDTTPIISARKRSDLKWGFECICGNDTRLCKEELEHPTDFVKSDSVQTMNGVIDRLRQSSDDSFVMTEV